MFSKQTFISQQTSLHRHQHSDKCLSTRGKVLTSPQSAVVASTKRAGLLKRILAVVWGRRAGLVFWGRGPTDMAKLVVGGLVAMKGILKMR